ncbi:MAG: hypothetical protein KBA30_01255 [Clostridia bacterium]|nr:hypothetical protein [Clostridia bacterium]
MELPVRDFRDGKHARALLDMQRPDGSWGQFHSQTAPYREPTTEQALRRLRILGFTRTDEPIRRALSYLRDCLDGRRTIPDRREKWIGFDMYMETALAAGIREFDPDDPSAARIAARWREVVSEAFSGGFYDEGAYRSAFLRVFGFPCGNHARYIDFVALYPVALLAAELGPETGAAVVRYVLDHPAGLYYVSGGPLRSHPKSLADRGVSAWMAAIGLLARYPGERARGELRFAADWLEQVRDPAGFWDMGPGARDGIYLPLSDSWRDPGVRRSDCTLHVGELLGRLRTPDSH